MIQIPNDSDSAVTRMTIQAPLKRVSSRTLVRLYKAVCRIHRELRQLGDIKGCIAAEKVEVALIQELSSRGISTTSWWH